MDAFHIKKINAKTNLILDEKNNEYDIKIIETETYETFFDCEKPNEMIILRNGENLSIKDHNIEKALSSLNASEDAGRKKLIKEKSRTLNIDSEQARIKEHREFVNKIIKTFEGTEYEKKTNNILRFIEKQDEKTPRVLYTGSLHEFGREDGRAIYQMLKQVV